VEGEEGGDHVNIIAIMAGRKKKKGPYGAWRRRLWLQPLSQLKGLLWMTSSGIEGKTASKRTVGSQVAVDGGDSSEGHAERNRAPDKIMYSSVSAKSKSGQRSGRMARAACLCTSGVEVPWKCRAFWEAGKSDASCLLACIAATLLLLFYLPPACSFCSL